MNERGEERVGRGRKRETGKGGRGGGVEGLAVDSPDGVWQYNHQQSSKTPRKWGMKERERVSLIPQIVHC